MDAPTVFRRRHLRHVISLRIPLHLDHNSYTRIKYLQAIEQPTRTIEDDFSMSRPIFNLVRYSQLRPRND